MKTWLYMLFLAAFLLPATGLKAQTPLAQYSFSGDAKDLSPNGNHAQVQGAVLTQDRFGWAKRAIAFDGKQGGLTASSAAYLNTPKLTLSFWIRVDALPAQGEVYLLSHGGWQERWKVSLPSHGKPVFTTHPGFCCSDMDSGTPLTVGSWTHVAMVHDGSKDIIYLNGVQANEKSVVGDLDPTTYPLGIGYDPIDKGNFFEGALDEVQIYGEALDAAQIAALYAAQSAAPTVADGVVAHYGFRGNANDGSPFGNHANNAGAVAGTDRFGFGHSAFRFDGVASEVTAPSSTVLNSPATTVAFWVKVNALPANGEAFLLSNGGWQERWKISLPSHGKPVWTTNHSGGISDMDSGGGNELQVGTWTHVVMVHDGAKDKIYIDGAMVAEKNVAGTLNATGYPLGIGYNPIDGGNWFDGELDEVMIYNYALNDAEIADLYGDQSAFPGTPSDLVASYGLNGNGKDDSQFGNDAHPDLEAFPVANRHGWGNNAMSGHATADPSAALQSDYTTICFWVKPNSFPGSGEVFLLSHGGWQERWKISLPSHGKPVFTTHPGFCCSDMDSGTPLALDTWTHVVMVHDGSKDIIYFNGAQVAEKNVSGTLSRTRYPLGIGYDPIDKGGHFDGSLDDILIYDRALSAAEIADLFNAQSTAPVVPGSLVANYPFNGSGADETDYRNDASGVSLAKDRFGKANKAANFDGKEEVTAANSAQQNSPYTTVAFWVNLNSLPANGEVYLLSNGGWQERWKISLPSHGKPVWTTNHSGGISDMDSGGGNELPVGVWKHVAMVHDGAKDKIYIDGAMVAEKNVVGTLNSTTYPLGIGYNAVDGGNVVDGRLDEVRIYNVALSDAEIASLYAEQSQDPGDPDSEAPCAPMDLSASVSFTNVFLSWSSSTDNVGVTGYNVYQDGSLIATTTSEERTVSGLKPLTQFLFGVSAVDAAGNESAISTLKVTSGDEETPDTTPPTTPGNLSGQAGSNSVILSWEASTDDRQLAGYVVLVDGAIFDTVDASQLSIFIGGLDSETPYSFEVYAFDAAGNNSGIAELTLTTGKPLDTGEPGLVAHYPFEGNANDATPYNNHGVIGGNPVFESVSHPNGTSGQAIKFDGDQDSVLAANAVQLISDYTTVSFWIRVDGKNIQDAEAYVMDFGHWDQRWKISLPQHLKIVWTTNSKNTQFPNFISDMDSGDGNEMVQGFWWYVTMVHDGTNDIIYVNGEQTNIKPAPGTLNSTARPLCFGNNPIEGGQYFIGALDEVKIYNKALTAAEIKKLFNQGTTGTEEEEDLLGSTRLLISPNPVRDMLYIDHELPTNQSLQLRVFDMQGRQVDDLRIAPQDLASGRIAISMERYNQGMYTLNFVLGGKNLGSRKFERH